MKTRKLRPDLVLFGIVAAMLTIGVVLVFDASFARAGAKLHDSWYFVKRQLAFAGVGMIILLVTTHLNLRFYRLIAKPMLALAVLALGLVLIFGESVNGAQRWFRFGPVNIQPSEFAKLAIVFYLAHALARQKSRIRYLGRGVIRHLLWAGLLGGLILLEPDMGTTAILVGTGFIMLFAAGAANLHLGSLAACGLAGAAGLIWMEPYRIARVKAFIDPFKYYHGIGYQNAHGLLALGTGGLWGIGLVEGREKFFLPAAYTDFIFATLAEEAGLLGGLAIVALFAVFTYRGMQIARGCRSSYGALLAAGMTGVIALQALVNIAVVSSSIPATGVPLPFVSYGGSSLISAMIAAGVLLSVSRNRNEVMDEDSEADESVTYRRRYERAHISGTVRRTRVPRERVPVRTAVRR